MTMRAKRYQTSAALLIFMRRTTIPNSSFKQSFQTQSRDSTPHGLPGTAESFAFTWNDIIRYI